LGGDLRYARKLGLDETQAQDVLQETMVALMRILPEFAYDRNKGSFGILC
jgi:DNA-directed RNA polymerase specialized sigma24 family protein